MLVVMLIQNEYWCLNNTKTGRNSMKKLVTVMVVICLCSALFANGAKETASKTRTPITMWFWGSNPTQQEILKKNLVDVYNASQEDYELVIEYRASVDSDITVALAAGEGPDIVYGSGPAFISPYAEAGKLENLDAYAAEYGWADTLVTPLYNTLKINDSLYAVPIAMFASGLHYNKKVLEANGWELPKTIDELVVICEDALSKGMYPILFGVKGWLPSLESIPSLFFTQWAGPTAVYDCLTNQQKWNNPKMVAALQAVDEWYQKGYLCKDMFDISSGEARSLLVDGAAPFLLSSPAGYQGLATFAPTDAEAENFGFIPFPSGNEGIPDPVYTIAINATLSVNANSKHKEEAAKILSMTQTQDFMEKMTADWPGYWCTALKDYSTIDTSKMHVLGKQCVAIMQTLTKAVNEGNFGFYSSTFYPAATASVMQNIDTLWYGTSSISEILDKMDAEFAKEFANGSVPELTKPAN